jgi:hypothetical protein
MTGFWRTLQLYSHCTVIAASLSVNLCALLRLIHLHFGGITVEFLAPGTISMTLLLPLPVFTSFRHADGPSVPLFSLRNQLGGGHTLPRVVIRKLARPQLEMAADLGRKAELVGELRWRRVNAASAVDGLRLLPRYKL